ncbi:MULTISPECIES: helix-turn-helix domain-containing protein [unclassified Myroides]|uniref:helix-turn-helix domain-containing protein n=1 Tax=unclassified Myroides TaxID=2642485 RepID=UPI0015FCE220|nr:MULTISPECIES: helix-turn-helix domain-containing protein [unclassified Myroides]MBB1151213.1 helix-turn-helix domain-containing protein [Myroides sp. NP-2]MDM1408423.1 helix-turn-helix domain-containing protein [Myroides sp. DF42-4-2]
MRKIALQENVIQTSSSEVLTRLKVLLGVRTAKELAEIFDLKPNTISSWKKRNTMSYAKVIEVCHHFNIDLNELFFSDYQNLSIDKSYRNIPIIYIEDYLEYYLSMHAKPKKLKQIYVPKQVGFEIVIQLYTTLKDQVNAKLVYAFCKKVQFADITMGENYVFLLKNKGFQKYNVVEVDKKNNRISLYKETEELSWVNAKEIVEVYHIVNYLSC